MKNLRPIVLGALVAAAAAFALQTVPESHADDGQWVCYVADRFPEMDKAAEWKGSLKVSEGLNQVASHVQKGQILVLELPVKKGWGMMGGGGDAGAPSVVCVKG